MIHNSKFIFWGTPEFSAVILEKLISAGFIPEAVVCNPDKPVGRKKIIAPPPIKTIIMNYESGIKNKIKIFQPENLSLIHDSLFMLQPDIFIVAAYAKIIPKEILDIPRLGTIGVHPSLLPKYRGSSPIQAAILNDDKETGTTLYLMDEKIDHGAIIANSELRIQNLKWDYELLTRKLTELSADLLIETLPNIENKIKNAKPQDETRATYTKKFRAEDGYVAPEDFKKSQEQGGETAGKIDRKIRALNPEPGVFTIINNKRMKILEAKLTPEGKLKLKKIQIEGKKPTEIKN